MRRALGLVVTLIASTLVAVGAPMVVEPAQAGGSAPITNDYTLLRAKPHGFVIGQAYRGDRVVVQQDPVESFRWGRIEGNFRDCAWIYHGAVGSTSSAPDQCRHEDRGIDESRFARFIALGGDTLGNPKNGTDGLAAHVDLNNPQCTIKASGYTAAFGNVDAIEGGTDAPKNFLFIVPQGHPLIWRYLTRDYRWFMVHDTSRGPTDDVGEPSWYYVQSHCLAIDQATPNRYIP